MATGTDKRSKALHNFTMPCNLRWGNQKFLRCMKVNGGCSDAGQISTPRSAADHRHRTARDGRACKDHSPDDQFPRRSPKLAPTEGRRRFDDDDGGDDGIAAVRQKVMLDLQTAADKMKSAIFKDGLEKGEVFISSPPDGEINRPWNLRTRRAACKNGGGASSASADGGGKGLVIPDMKVAAAAVSNKLPIQRSGGGAASTAAASGEKRDRGKLSVPLSKSEIEEDFLAMVGHRPPRRPKKRARTIQKQIDMVFPGLWLTEVTPDMYKVDEAAP